MVAGRSFSILFALAGSDSVDMMSLGHRLGINDAECRKTVEDLQNRYLVDLVSRLDGQSVKETLSLTEEGEAVLLRSLERMCELPERSSG
jgi:hypothetical protein